jgi:hypothetical protein
MNGTLTTQIPTSATVRTLSTAALRAAVISVISLSLSNRSIQIEQLLNRRQVACGGKWPVVANGLWWLARRSMTPCGAAAIAPFRLCVVRQDLGRQDGDTGTTSSAAPRGRSPA